MGSPVPQSSLPAKQRAPCPDPSYPASTSAKTALHSLLLPPLWESVNQTHKKFLVCAPVEKEKVVYVHACVHRQEAS